MGAMILCAGVYARCWNTEDFVCILMMDIPQTFLYFSFYVIMTKRASDMNGHETVRFMRCRYMHDLS
jgi:hypothetical protein